MVARLNQVDTDLALQVATALGLKLSNNSKDPGNKSIPADGDPQDYASIIKQSELESSPALSMANTIKDSIKTRKIAVLAADGVNAKSFASFKAAIEARGATLEVIAPHQGQLLADDKSSISIDESLLTASSVCYDAVFVPDGKTSVSTLLAEPDAIHFLNQSFKHCKAIATAGAAKEILAKTYFSELAAGDKGVIVGESGEELNSNFIAAVAAHRVWEREKPRKVPS